jgi:hypothetical protein
MTENHATFKVSTLEDIREQTKEEIIPIPGFKAGAVLHIKVRPVDLTSLMLEHDLSNPLVDKLRAKAEKGKLNTQAQVQAALEKELENEKQRSQRMKEMEPTFNAVCRAAMVEPTYDEVEAIKPMTMLQKVAIFNWASRGAEQLNNFRQ